MARFLKIHPKIIEVYFPGCEDSPYHELANKQMRAYGTIVSFKILGGIEETKQFIKELKFFTCGLSIGSVESLICVPKFMTHKAVPQEKLDEYEITDNLVRMSLGIEDIEDLLEDVDHALSKI